MQWFVDFINGYWLSILLLTVLVGAIWYVYKRREKYEKNRFE